MEDLKSIIQTLSSKVDELYNELIEKPKIALKDWLSEDEAQQLLGKSGTTLWRLRTNGKIKFTKEGHTTYYSRESIQKLLNRNARDIF